MKLRSFAIAFSSLAVTACTTIDDFPTPAEPPIAGYRLVESPIPMWPVRINDSGIVLGAADQSLEAVDILWLWNQGTTRTLAAPPLPGGAECDPKIDALAVNNAGEVAGSVQGCFLRYAVKWGRGGVPVILPGAASFTTHVEAVDINTAGDVAGLETAQTTIPESTPGDYTTYGLLWTASGGAPLLLNLPPNTASTRWLNTLPAAITDNGRVFGMDHTGRTIVWDLGAGSGPPPASLYGAPTATKVVDANDVGQALLQRGFEEGFIVQPYIGAGKGRWRIRSLWPADPNWSVFVHAINNDGAVVGTHAGNEREYAFLWTEAAGRQDLNELIHPCDPLAGVVELNGAWSINNRGEIAAYSHNGRGYVLRPVVERCLATAPTPPPRPSALRARPLPPEIAEIAAPFERERAIARFRMEEMGEAPLE